MVLAHLFDSYDYLRARSTRLRTGDCSQQGFRAAADLACCRRVCRYGRCTLRPLGRGTLRGGRSHHLGTVAAGIRDVEASGGATRGTAATDASDLKTPAKEQIITSAMIGRILSVMHLPQMIPATGGQCATRKRKRE